MNEDINIAEILKDAPTGTLLYSPIFGELAYIGSYADEGQTYSIIICQYPDAIGQGDSVSVKFDENGTYLNRGYSSRREGECMLFPSKGNRDWQKFKVPKKHKEFKPFQKVLCIANNSHDCEVWSADFYSHYNESTREHYLASGFVRAYDKVIPYEGNEDKLGKPVK